MSTSTEPRLAPSAALTETRDIAKALSDTNRLRIVSALRGRELCVCHLVEMLAVDASNVSRHVSILRRAGLVAVRRDGRWAHCRRADPKALIWKAIDGLLAAAPELEEDAAALDAPGSC